MGGPEGMVIQSGMIHGGGDECSTLGSMSKEALMGFVELLASS